MQFTTALAVIYPECQVHKKHRGNPVQIRPPSVLVYLSNYWLTGSGLKLVCVLAETWRQIVPELCQNESNHINLYLCWKCGPMLPCGPAMSWCWGPCGAPPVWPSSCRMCSSSTGRRQRENRIRSENRHLQIFVGFLHPLPSETPVSLH